MAAGGTPDARPDPAATAHRVTAPPMLLMSPADAAHLAHVPLRTLYRWIANGHIASLRRGPRRTLVDLNEVIAKAEGLT